MTSVRTIHQTLTRHDRAFERIDNRAFHRSQIPVTINRAIPMKARKGQKYIFLDGVIKFRVRQKDVAVYPELADKFPAWESDINGILGIVANTEVTEILDTAPPKKPDDIPMPIPASISGDGVMLPATGTGKEVLSASSFQPITFPPKTEVESNEGAITYAIYSPEKYFSVNKNQPICVEILRTGNPIDYTRDIKVTFLSRDAAFETARPFTRVENWKKYNYRTIDRSEVHGVGSSSGIWDAFVKKRFDVYYRQKCVSKKRKNTKEGYDDENLASKRKYLAWKHLSSYKFSDNFPIGRSVRLRVRVYPAKRRRKGGFARANSNYIEGIMLIRKMQKEDGSEAMCFSLVH